MQSTKGDLKGHEAWSKGDRKTFSNCSGSTIIERPFFIIYYDKTFISLDCGV